MNAERTARKGGGQLEQRRGMRIREPRNSNRAAKLHKLFHLVGRSRHDGPRPRHAAVTIGAPRQPGGWVRCFHSPRAGPAWLQPDPDSDSFPACDVANRRTAAWSGQPNPPEPSSRTYTPPCQGEWRVVSTGGSKYDNVDLSENEWSDYCEKAAASVGIYGFESKFELYRGS